MSHKADYIDIIDRIYGACFDATYGFHLQLKEISTQQANACSHLATNQERSALIHDMDSKPLTYSIPSVNLVAHQTTVGEAKSRNFPDGKNCQWVTKMAIVTMYEYWDANYREKIAKSNGYASKDDLKIDEFGDLRIYRHAILHRTGKGTDAFKNLKVFTWFKCGEQISIDLTKLDTMVTGLKSALVSYV